MADPEVRGVCLGTLPLRQGEGLHNFKMRMGYEVSSHDAVIVVHSMLEPLATSRLAGPFVRQAGRWNQLAALAESLEILAAGARVSSLDDRRLATDELAEWMRRRTVCVAEGECDV